jgi:hypothetical protein
MRVLLMLLMLRRARSRIRERWRISRFSDYGGACSLAFWLVGWLVSARHPLLARLGGVVLVE